MQAPSRRALLLAFALVLCTKAFPLEAGMVVHACFSPRGKCAGHIVEAIHKAQKEILVAVYAFTSYDLAWALIEANRRGVKVRVALDRHFNQESEHSKGTFLKQEGVAVRRVSGLTKREGAKGLMHQKFAVIDGKAVLTGSYNWTASAGKIQRRESPVFSRCRSSGQGIPKGIFPSLEESAMRPFRRTTLLWVMAAFIAGFLADRLFQRWVNFPRQPRGHPVTFAPLPARSSDKTQGPVVKSWEVDKIRTLAGSQARVRGRVYRVGHSTKSNTYFSQLWGVPGPPLPG